MDQASAFSAATAVFEWATNNVAKVGEDRSPIFLLGFSLGGAIASYLSGVFAEHVWNLHLSLTCFTDPRCDSRQYLDFDLEIA